MKVFIKLTVLTLVVVVLCSLYFEYCINRPLNVYLQYTITAIMIIGVAAYLIYMVKQLLKILNP
jgi:hypothetical protein